MSMNARKHFHTFDALRFFSFLLVFFHHIPPPSSIFLSFFTKSGGIGVSFFFVLSGFLITYILLYEKITTGQVALSKFFIRRILRIWPLFYAMILFAFLTPYILDFLNISGSSEGYKPNWLMSMLFLENYKMILTGSFPDTSPLRVMWSLCIEEHFYIIWGIAFYFISLKRVPYLILICLLFANISRVVYGYLGIPFLDLFSNIDYFAFGAIPAYILLFKSEIINRVEKLSLKIKYIVVFITATLIFGIPNLSVSWLPYLSPIIYGVFFSATILFTLPASNSIYIKDNCLLSKLGIFTYGLYLFHTIVINLLIHTKQMFPFELNWVTMSILSLTITILFSIISYYLFEKQFLKLKRYFY